MLRFVLRRVLLAAVLVLGLASAGFLLTQVAPGDYFTDFGPGYARRARVERSAAGFDRPLPVLFASWLARAVRLDFGQSLKFQRPVRDLVWPRVLNTAALGVCALTIATLFGIPLGVFTGSGDTGIFRTWVSAISSVLLALPTLFLVLALMAVLARFGWLPPPGVRALSMLPPALALALPAMALIERTHSHAIRRTLREPYILGALARGVPVSTIVCKHAMRVALNTTLGTFGLAAGSLLSGSFVVELIADWPGLAALTADALRARDPFLLAGCVGAAGGVLAAVVLFADILHLWVDPRLQQT